MWTITEHSILTLITPHKQKEGDAQTICAIVETTLRLRPNYAIYVLERNAGWLEVQVWNSFLIDCICSSYCIVKITYQPPNQKNYSYAYAGGLFSTVLSVHDEKA